MLRGFVKLASKSRFYIDINKKSISGVSSAINSFIANLSLSNIMKNNTTEDLGPPYSISVPNTETANCGATRRCFRREIPPGLSCYGCYTLYEGFYNGLRLNPYGPCLGYRPMDSSGKFAPFVFFSYSDVAKMIADFGGGLCREKMFSEKKGLSLIGLYTRNCVQWTVSAFACYSYRGTIVPLYDTLGASSVVHILQETELKTVVSGNQDNTMVLLRSKHVCPRLQFIIQVDGGFTPEMTKMAAQSGVVLYSFDDILRIGQAYGHPPPTPPIGTDVCLVCYTSGTTGGPKGALVTHSNLIAAIRAGVDSGLEIATSDRYLSYLPLPHIYEQMMHLGILCNGASVGYVSQAKDVSTVLVEDLKALQPTLFATVPRVLNRIYDKIMAGVNALPKTSIKRFLFYSALNAKLDHYNRTGKLTHSIYDPLVFNKLKAAIGLGSVKRMVTGSAPISGTVLKFWRVVTSVDIHEGYGQTEGSGIATVSMNGDMQTNHVGGPVPACEIRLEDVPEMGYSHMDKQHEDGRKCEGRGEVCIRGPNVFRGYLGIADSGVDEDGWLHSGDIGMWLAETGQLAIIDRKKNIFKLSQGEYISPEKIEDMHVRDIKVKIISQSFVYGDSLQSSLVAIIVLDKEEAKKVQLTDGQSMEVFVMKQLIEAGEKAGLAGFEFVRSLTIVPHEFSVDNGLITPTMKLRRHQLKEHFKQAIQQMYSDIQAGNGLYDRVGGRKKVTMKSKL